MAETYAYHDISSDEIRSLLRKRKSFTLTNFTSINQSVKKLESIIESEKLSCRIYTAGRSASMAATFTPAALWGIASAAAIAAHNIATLTQTMR